MKLKDLFSDKAQNVSNAQNLSDISLDPKQQFLLNLEIASLKRGQIIQGEVVGKEGNIVQILLHDDFVFSARIDKNLDLNLGKMITFEVTSHAKGNLSLSPLFENMGTDTNVLKALDMAELPINKNTIAMTEEMMHQEMPIDRKSLVEVFKKTLKFPQNDPKSLVHLMKLGMEVTENNIQQLENYQCLKHQVTNDLTNILNEIPIQYENLKSAGNISDACEFMKQMIDLVTKNESVFNSEITLKTTLNEEVDVQSLLKESMENNHISTIIDHIQKYDFSFKEISELLKNSPLEIQEKILDEILFGKDKKYLKEFQKNILKDCFIVPSDVQDKKNIEELYHKLKTQITNMKVIADSTLKNEGAFTKSVTNLQNNLEFMQQLNQVYSYVQLPLQMSNGKTHGELFVYTNKKSLADSKGKISALLHLDMKNLGPVDVYVALEEQKVNTHFYLPNEENLLFIEKHLNILDEHLSCKGYSLKAEMSVRSDTKETLQSILNSDRSVERLAKYSFDVRA